MLLQVTFVAFFAGLINFAQASSSDFDFGDGLAIVVVMIVAVVAFFAGMGAYARRLDGAYREADAI